MVSYSMDLSLTHLSFCNFRNYKTFSLDDIGPLVILVGPNAVGKTNIIEGIQLLTSQTSFRNPLISQIPFAGTDRAYASADIAGNDRLLKLELVIKDDKKKYFLNKKARNSVDLKGILPSVVFTPDDLVIAKGSMYIRRSALDAIGSHLSKNYYLIKKDYDKILHHKNRALKDEASEDVLESINELIVTCGAQLTCYRCALFEKLSQVMGRFYHEITKGGETLDTCYIPSWQHNAPPCLKLYDFDRDDARGALSCALTAQAGEERARHRALIGPHADKIEFYVNGKNVTSFGSQGQQRSVVLAFKLAEVTLIQTMLHQNPLLLLDDVMSELDTYRRHALLSFIIEGDIQTLITTTTLSYFDENLISSAQVIPLGNQTNESFDQGDFERSAPPLFSSDGCFN